ncbi:uncharacterized protein SPPG_08397 [Spizellomyces punctatus DAOM BR117]|uniref:MPN domain-containing protein n=1 Tax=Spizellomyces punctatus (strain DAOM BR117) TaxID=645134 RepID=A0A0L0H6A2_SPIPD|nr:uncharacterized protein SPPG_08397 [Spizellomyces punctatus DAOM BR117]KNC96243.1 hypothetical protein SPPG_08397 [Spizellomyces punctatus DAOM BR117]|eukprot:XP_016604283.1 hypothetical protein SPPG_08397 [Spizellomyces punctatus DAOM BR117]
MASRLYPTVQMSKDIFLALHAEGQAEFFQAILFGVREMCDDEELVVHVKGFVPFHASGNDLVPALSQLLSLHGQTVIGWFAAAPFRRDFGNTVNSLGHISHDMATIYFEVFQRALFRTFLLNWKKELSSETSGGTSEFVDEASVILKDLVGLVCVRGSPLAGSSAIFSYQSPSINTDQLIAELAGSSGQFPFLSAETASGFPELKDIEKLHESFIRDTVAEHVKGDLNGAEVLATLAHPSPLQDTNNGIAPRKRKSTADIPTDRGSKKVKTDSKLAQEIRRIPDENIQVFPGQRSDFLRRVNSSHSMIFCSPFDELSFSSLLPSDPTAERVSEFSELTPNLISKYDAMSTYMTTTVATKMERYQETCKKYNVLLRCLDSLNRINRENIRKAVLKEGKEGNEAGDDVDVAVPMEGVEQSENAAEGETTQEADNAVHAVQREREGDKLVVTNGAMSGAPSSIMSSHETPARNDEKAQRSSEEKASPTGTTTQPMDLSTEGGRESLSDNVAAEAENAAKSRGLSSSPSGEIEASVSNKLVLHSPTGRDSDEVERPIQEATVDKEETSTSNMEIEPRDSPKNISNDKAEVNEEETIKKSMSPEEEPPTPTERAPEEAKRDVTPPSLEKPEIPSEPKTDNTEEMEEPPRAVEKLTAEPIAEIEAPAEVKPAPRRIGLQEYLRQKGKLPSVTSTSTEPTPPSLEGAGEEQEQQNADVPPEIPKPQTPELGQTPSDVKAGDDKVAGSGEDQENKNDQPKETDRSPQYTTRERTPVKLVKQADDIQSNQDADGKSPVDSSVSEPAKNAKGTGRRDIGSEASKTATAETIASPHRSTSSRVSSRSSSVDGRQQSTSRSAPASTITSDKDDVEEGEVSDSMDRRSTSSGRQDRTRRSGYFGSTPLYTSLYGDRPSREPSSPGVASRRLERDGSRGWSPLSSGGRDRERDRDRGDRDRAGSKERERHWDGRERERDRGDREGSFNSYRPGSGTWDRDRDRERYSYSRERDRDSYQPERERTERTERDSYQPDRERTERDSYQPERDRDRGERDSYQPDRDRDRERAERERFGGDSYHPSRDSGSGVSSWRPRDARPR